MQRHGGEGEDRLLKELKEDVEWWKEGMERTAERWAGRAVHIQHPLP